MRTLLFLGRLRLKGYLLRTTRSGPFWKKLLGDRSREICLREGDKNIRYFQKMANARARRNFLSKFRVNEVSFSSNEEIKE